MGVWDRNDVGWSRGWGKELRGRTTEKESLKWRGGWGGVRRYE